MLAAVQGSALHAMGSAVEGDTHSGSIISVEKSLAPMSFTALLELNQEQVALIFDHIRWRTQHTLFYCSDRV